METIVQKLNPLKHFRLDTVLIDNPIFKLHHQVNFFLVFFGAVFIYGTNYLDKDAIVCLNGGDFARQYCWLHGSGHIPDDLSKKISGEKCRTNQIDANEDPERITHYYLWIPFVLTLLLAIIKMPRSLWKAIEGGFVKNVIGDGNPEKILQSWFREGLKRKARLYNYSYALCEMLNIFCLISCFLIVDTLFDTKFGKYGTDVLNHNSTKGEVNEMCNLFPTEVSCNVKSGGIDGGVDNANTLCILSNNLFNQYYFLILWFWWVSLMAISAGGFVYRLAQILSSAVSKQIFIFKTKLYVENLDVENIGNYSQEEYFLLGRICQNLKGSQIQQLMKELEHSESLTTVSTATAEEKSLLKTDD